MVVKFIPWDSLHRLGRIQIPGQERVNFGSGLTGRAGVYPVKYMPSGHYRKSCTQSPCRKLQRFYQVLGPQERLHPVGGSVNKKRSRLQFVCVSRQAASPVLLHVLIGSLADVIICRKKTHNLLSCTPCRRLCRLRNTCVSCFVTVGVVKRVREVIIPPWLHPRMPTLSGSTRGSFSTIQFLASQTSSFSDHRNR